VSKRVRGTVRPHRRPGARPPSERVPGQRRAPPAAAQSQLEVAEVVEVVAEEAADQRPAPARAEVERAAPKGTRVHHKIKAGSILAARAATEYVYVPQDIRRIVLVAASLIAVLFLLWFLIVVAKVIPLPFY